MSISWELSRAIQDLCHRLPESIEKLAEASKRREPIIIMVPQGTTMEQMKAFSETLKEALRG